MKVLVTGAHGFIGYHVCKQLVKEGHEVLGVDRLRNALSDKSERSKLHQWTVLE